MEVTTEEVKSKDKLADKPANAPSAFGDTTSIEGVEVDMQTKLLIAGKAIFRGFENDETNNFMKSGDGAKDPLAKFKTAIPGTSKVVKRVKSRVKAPSEQTLRPILSRKSKEKAKQLIQDIIKGKRVISAPLLILGRMVQKRNNVKGGRRTNLKMPVMKKIKVPKNSLQTVWARKRDRRMSSSNHSFSSFYDCGRCSSCDRY